MITSTLFGGMAVAAPATNPAGEGPGIAIGTGSNAGKDKTVAIGESAKAEAANGIAIGAGSRVNSYVEQPDGIAIGTNAHAEVMAGNQEALFSFNQTPYRNTGSAYIPEDPSKTNVSIAIGRNTYARSGSIMIGDHNYNGKIGGITMDSSNMSKYNIVVGATTIGTNSSAAGAFSALTGANSIMTGDYNGGRAGNWAAAQNFGATITGAFNSIESRAGFFGAFLEGPSVAGMASSIVGVANRIEQSNGTLIMGAGNEVTNSLVSLPAGLENKVKEGAEKVSVEEFAGTLRDVIRKSDSAGSVGIFGGGNKVDYGLQSMVTGVNNTITGTSRNIAKNNYISGFKNTVENSSNVYMYGVKNTVAGSKGVVLSGDNHKVTGGDNSIILGTADTETDHTAKDAVVIGHNAKVETEGGVALGAGSVANVDKGAVGFDIAGEDHSADDTGTWKSTAAAVSVGDVANKVTRQIAGVAAGTQDTDAVNVAQLKGVQKSITKLGNRVTTVEGDVKNIKGDITNIKTDVNTNKGNIQKNTENITKVDNRVTTVEGDVKNIKGDITNIKTDVTTNKTNIQTNTDNITNLGNRVTTVEGDVNTNKTNIQKHTDKLENHEFRITELEKKDYSGDFTSINNRINDVDNRVTNNVTNINKNTEAINNIDKRVTKNEGDIINLNGKLDRLEDDSNRGDAMNAALAALHPLQFDLKNPTQIMAGVGYYRNAKALALGLAHYENEDTMMHAGMAYSGNSHFALNAGLTWKFGMSKKHRERMPERYQPGPISSVYVLEGEMALVMQENERQKEKLAFQEAKIASQDMRLAELEAKLAKLLAEK